MVSGAIQGPEGKDPFILYSLSLLKGSRAIKKTHGCDEFPWLSAAAGWDSRGDEWSGKQNEGRRADWKENEEEKSRGESGIKESEEKTKGGSADCLLFSCRLRFLPCCHGRGFPALPSSLQPSDPILLPCWLGLLPLPFLRTLEDRHPAAGHDRRARSPALHPEGPKDKQQNPGIARNLQTERACVSLYMARDLQCRRFVYAHVRTGALPQLATTALVYYKQNKLLFRAGSFLLWNQSPFQKMAQCTLESLPV